MFLIFGTKVGNDIWRKVTEPFFPGKIWIIQKFGSFKKIFFCELSDSDSKNAKKKNSLFGRKWSEIWHLVVLAKKARWMPLKMFQYWSIQKFYSIRKYFKMKLWQRQQQQQQPQQQQQQQRRQQ